MRSAAHFCIQRTTRRVIGLKCVIRGFFFARPGHRRSSQASEAPSATMHQSWPSELRATSYLPRGARTGGAVPPTAPVVMKASIPAGGSLLADLGNRDLNHNHCWLRIHAQSSGYSTVGTSSG